MLLVTTSNTKATCISHQTDEIFRLAEKETQLKSILNPALPLEQELEILKQLTQFDLGRYLLENKGLNGFYTAYIILHGPQNQNLSDLENWILHKAPLVKATQERFEIFNQQIQKYLTDDIILALIPCGLMDDLLHQDYTKFKNVHLVGIDIDPESLNFASEKSKNASCQTVSLIRKDAWNLNTDRQYHIIVSNGLNIYEPDDLKVVKLYQEFYYALKAGGIFITSFVTPPPTMSPESTWHQYNADDLLKQRALFGDIIGVSWQKYRTESEARLQLEQVR